MHNWRPASRSGPVAAGESILEIGCGLGLASLVGHRRGADMSASDRDPLAGALLAENLRLNGRSQMKYRVGDWAVRARPTICTFKACTA